jgi:hypothetical protein
MLPPSIWIGFDPREAAAFAVARDSIRRHLNKPVPINGIVLDEMRRKGLYTRATERRKSAVDGDVLWDVISDAPMSTEFSISRFLTYHLARQHHEMGWAMFADCDVLARADISPMFEYQTRNQDFAVMCVKHRYIPKAGTKMDGQVQTQYSRKNWSSVTLYNLAHPSNRVLTPELVNELPGRDLHGFCWLKDYEIGELPVEWNYLVGETPANVEPKLVHFTLGIPTMRGYEDQPYADEWRAALSRWAA